MHYELHILYFPSAFCVLVILSILNHVRRSIKKTKEVWIPYHKPTVPKKQSQIQHHEVTECWNRLVREDGAGAWPPKCTHDEWPLSLQPYRDIYFKMIDGFSVAQASLDNETNIKKRADFRVRMRKLLSDHVNIAEVERLMAATETGHWSELSRDKYNAFYCCVAVCRHMYRWATMPVVKVAQEEKVIDFPCELDVPWGYLQRKFGVTAESGNNTANVIHNFNTKGERIYKINIGMNELITNSEEAFFRMFYDLEVLAYPMYHNMVQVITSFEKNDRVSCLVALRNINANLRNVLSIFYQQLTEARVSKDVWISYVQGFQGWGVGRMVNGEFIKYDGLSGNHVLAFQALDAFLGMDRYLTDENMERYIPANQRLLCVALKKHSIRKHLSNSYGDAAIEEEFTKIVNRMKVFRAAHRTRVMPYLEKPAPERHTMTAGKSVLEGPSSREALQVLDKMLVQRLQETR